ncbi:hypothetical protein [Oerskovia paurometabola]|uniref:hypothetical protein n=1 Tax=Oerskovia paurometabola TaxID=162170 RepID=UPI00381A4356
MVDDITWSLSGIDALRWGLQSVSIWRPPVTVRRSPLEVPGRHGVLEVGLPLFEAPTVPLTLWVHAPTQTALEAAAMELIGVLTAPGLTLTRTSGTLVCAAPASLVSVSPDEFKTAAEATFEAVLTIPTVFLRDLAPITSAPIPADANTTAEVPALAGGTAPITDAVVRVQGPCTAVQVVDVVTGTGLSWSGVLAAGEYLFMDAGSLTARRATSATAWTSGGSAVSGALDYPAAGPLALWPRASGNDPTDRRVTVKVTGAGRAPSTAVTIHARRAYL